MNTQHKLTAQMVAAYCNAQVREIKTGAIGNVLEIHFKYDILFVNEGDFGGYYSETRNFQLVLTSPDKITEREAIEAAYMQGKEKARNEFIDGEWIGDHDKMWELPDYFTQTYGNK